MARQTRARWGFWGGHSRMRHNACKREQRRLGGWFMRTCFFLVCVFAAVAVGAQDPSLVLNDGGIQFPDGTVQATAAAPGTAPVEDTGQQICYDPTGSTTDEIPCAMTGQDGELQRGVDWPAPRFTDNLDGTVTDNLTGLIWLKDANCATFFAPIDFEDALAEANGLSQGFCGLTDGSVAGDWRLPNIKELLSLVDYGESSPALPSGHPFGTSVQSSVYWSSSSAAINPFFAWVVIMNSGTSTINVFRDSLHFVWPVRSGQ